MRDLPIQGVPVLIDLKVNRWRCRNAGCEQKILVERLPSVAAVHARKSERLAEIVRLLGHAAGGRPTERLAGRLGLVASRDTVLRHLIDRFPGVTGAPSFEWLESTSGLGAKATDTERLSSISNAGTWSMFYPTARQQALRHGCEIILR